jgi:hypothetical protein
MWHTKIEAWILEQAGIEQPGEGARGWWWGKPSGYAASWSLEVLV